MHDRLADFVAFVRTVQASSFTVAAERLGISRPAVGKSVARLEKKLGVRLLNRTTRVLSLTNEGQLLYERCVRILDDLEEAELAVIQRLDAPHGPMRLDLPAAFGRLHVLPLLTHFLMQWTNVSATVTFSDNFTDLVAERIDLAIRIGGDEDSSLVSRVLAPNRLIVCASPAYLAAHGTPLTPWDLDSHDCLGFLSKGRSIDWHFASEGKSWSQPVSARMQLGQAEALRDVALAGAGIVQLSSFVVGRDVKERRLIPILQAYATTGPSIRAIYPSRRYLAPKIRMFIDLLAAEWADPPWDVAAGVG